MKKMEGKMDGYILDKRNKFCCPIPQWSYYR